MELFFISLALFDKETTLLETSGTRDARLDELQTMSDTRCQEIPRTFFLSLEKLELAMSRIYAEKW